MPVPVDRQVAPPPTTIVIFGASGDLTQRKLIPALYTLYAEDRLPPTFAVIGVARSDFGDMGPDAGFREHLRQGARENKRVGGGDDALWERFAAHLFYCRGDYDDPATFTELARRLAELDAGCENCGNHLFYLATPPQIYTTVIAGLGGCGPQPSQTGKRQLHAHHYRETVRQRSAQRAGAEPPDARGF